MKIKSIILTIILSLFYPFTFLQKVHKNQITFISLEHDNLSKDFKILHQNLKKENRYRLKTLLFKFEPNLLGNLKYGVACIRQLFAIQSSGLVIIDYNNFVVSKFPHRKEVKILEIWHATGALKKFGNYVKRDYQIKNYDYTIVNSDFYKGIYAKAFNIPEENVLVTGIPNNDKIFRNKFVTKTRRRLEEAYPSIVGKKVVMYAPTFRGKLSSGIKEVKVDLKRICQELGEDYIIVYKPHPLVDTSKYATIPNILMMKNELVSSIFCITDLLITDYSAIAIDWMVFKKPIISFVPDFKSYKRKTGFVFDYLKEFPGEITFNEEELIHAVKQANTNFDFVNYQAFCDKVYKFMDGKSTQRVLSEIHRIMGNEAKY